MTTVFYTSVYGATREYAMELGRLLDASVVDFADVSLAPSDGPAIVASYVHGPSVPAASFIKDHGFGSRPVAAVAVGMTLLEAAREKDQLAGMVPDVARFYLPGRMNYSELSAAHRTVMTGIISALKLKPRKSDNERAMIDAYDHDVGRVDFAELAPIVEWARAHGA
ncbi:flavodoxin domain-containing protein [Corynebacterium phoceense]|uniref:flavodoxin domain-containing protein n=1 Tax=Corynebacterium phoceense TaxID=1686286 RepID=UPI001D4C5110|nr:flavodoxin domain-containing protein [Corynebacterium phoceense]HJG43412.1 flavodoxin domain-containing protein [Corynebacterium phoceense]